MADFLGHHSVSARRYIQTGVFFCDFSIFYKVLAFAQLVEQVSV